MCVCVYMCEHAGGMNVHPDLPDDQEYRFRKTHIQILDMNVNTYKRMHTGTTLKCDIER